MEERATSSLMLSGGTRRTTSIIFDGQNNAAETAAGDGPVARLDFLQHRLPLLLAPLLRHDQKEIEDCEDRNHHQDRGRPATDALRQQTCLSNHLVSTFLKTQPQVRLP